MAYLPNYLRVAVSILLLVMYLRPAALLGTAGVALSAYLGVRRALRRQAAQQAAAEAAAAGGQATPPRQLTFGDAAAGGEEDGQQPALGALSTLGAWLLAAYTRCFPMILLAAALSTLTILLHGTTRKAPSEARHRGQRPLGYTLAQVLGRAPPGADPRLLFRQLWWLQRAWAERKARKALAWVRYWGFVLRDSLRSRRLR